MTIKATEKPLNAADFNTAEAILNASQIILSLFTFAGHISGRHHLFSHLTTFPGLPLISSLRCCNEVTGFFVVEMTP
jgi:hypothetical protein